MRKAPQRHGAVSDGLPRWGRPPRAEEGAPGQLPSAASLPHSFPRRSWEAWRKLATVWGELFLVTGSFVSGSRGQGDWEGAVCISSGPPPPTGSSPRRLGPRDRAARSVNPPPLPGPGSLPTGSPSTTGGPCSAPSSDCSLRWAPGPLPGPLAVSGGSSNSRNPPICTLLCGRPVPITCGLS